MWLEVSWRLPPSGLGPQWSGDTARKALAQWWSQHGSTFDTTLMHVDTEGRGLQSRSPFRFRALRDGFAIVAVGQDAVDHLEISARRVRTVLMEHFNGAVSEMRCEGTHSATQTSRVPRYVIKTLLICKQSAKQFDAIKALITSVDKRASLSFTQVKQLAERQIAMAMRRELDLLAYCGDPDEEIESDAETVRFDVQSAGALALIPVHGGYVWAARDVYFECSHALTGPWHLSRIPSRGYGLVMPATMPRASQPGAGSERVYLPSRASAAAVSGSSAMLEAA